MEGLKQEKREKETGDKQVDCVHPLEISGVIEIVLTSPVLNSEERSWALVN